MDRRDWLRTAGITTLVCGIARPLWASEQSHQWLQWRGPGRDGFVEPTSWPSSLDESHLVQSWRMPLGPSYSGPIVTTDQVFVTETKSAKQEVVYALDRATGTRNWATDWEGAMSVPFFARANGSWIRSTPACSGQRLFVGGMRDVLVCLDTADGREIWRIDFVKEFKSPLPSFGFVSSPLLTDKHLYVQAGASLVKLEQATGKVVWRSVNDGGGMLGSAFSSPVLATLAGVPQLVVQTREKLAGVSLEDGKVLWSQEITAFRGMNILTPTIVGDSIFTSAYGGRSLLLKVSRENDQFSVSEVWNNKVQGYMSSPVVIDQHVYIHLRNQRCACIDLRSGKEQWITRPYGKYWSMVGNGKQILALDERGELLLIEATPEEFRLRDTRKISNDSTWAHLAVCDKELFVRELNAISAYRWS